jgi:predicted ATPase
VLTRLKVSGFKNLVDADVYFGPFTCIAGPNGVGKSNLFDAIRFLSALADRTFLDAAKSVRDESGRTGDIRALFHRVGDTRGDRMRFEAEMIIPRHGTDDLGQPAEASATFLRYAVELGYRYDESGVASESLELLDELLTFIPQSQWDQQLRFPCGDDWRNTALLKSDRRASYISTKLVGAERMVTLHRADGKATGKTTKRPARQLPRTVLSATNAFESPTAVLARREMQSWRLLQLEPSALRKPDEFSAPPRLGADGSHLPATLYRLARDAEKRGDGPTRVYEQVAGRVRELIRDVREVAVDRDEKRELLTLFATDRYTTPFPARALSDGTLRFLALTVLELDPEVVGVICFEEPENGIHPARIPFMLRLLTDIAVDTDFPVGGDNPLRQVIVNTHSPLVVQEIADADLLGADVQEDVRDGVRSRKVVFRCLPNTWRSRLKSPPRPLPLGDLLAYLTPAPADDSDEPVRPSTAPAANGHTHPPARVTRVRERPDVRYLFDKDAPCP